MSILKKISIVIILLLIWGTLTAQIYQAEDFRIISGKYVLKDSSQLHYWTKGSAGITVLKTGNFIIELMIKGDTGAELFEIRSPDNKADTLSIINLDYQAIDTEFRNVSVGGEWIFSFLNDSPNTNNVHLDYVKFKKTNDQNAACPDTTMLEVRWDSNVEPDLAGYKIYYGEQSRNYDNVIDVGDTTKYIINRHFECGKEYFFAVTAYDESGNESEYSDEVSIIIPFEGDNIAPAKPGNIIIIIIKK